MSTLKLGYEVLEAAITRRTGPLPEGVRWYLRVAYFSGAAGMLIASKIIAELPAEEQQSAIDAAIAEIEENRR